MEGLAQKELEWGESIKKVRNLLILGEEKLIIVLHLGPIKSTPSASFSLWRGKSNCSFLVFIFKSLLVVLWGSQQVWPFLANAMGGRRKSAKLKSIQVTGSNYGPRFGREWAWVRLLDETRVEDYLWISLSPNYFLLHPSSHISLQSPWRTENW